MDLSKELHSIGHYLKDREEMINQVFSVIKGAKLEAMLSSTLKGLDKDQLKTLCLEQLEGMSRKRIKCILAGNLFGNNQLIRGTPQTNWILEWR